MKHHRVIQMCESCHQRPAVYRASARGTVPFLVCQGCKPVTPLRATRRGWFVLLALGAVLGVALLVLL